MSKGSRKELATTVWLTTHDIHERRKKQIKINMLSCAHSLKYTFPPHRKVR
jgi:hypothetical protein